MAKAELFKIRPVGWVLSRLGAFPVSRGAADEEAMTTTRVLLERGQAVVIFPEGTRIRHGSLRVPGAASGASPSRPGPPWSRWP
jgi:1-acyl-sn-glycerol-3-phosphate acyltransferase